MKSDKKTRYVFIKYYTLTIIKIISVLLLYHQENDVKLNTHFKIGGGKDLVTDTLPCLHSVFPISFHFVPLILLFSLLI